MPLKLIPIWACVMSILPCPILPKVFLDRSRKSLNQHATLELAIVCDKEFGDLFQHNQQRILEYWTVFFADLSLRFRTLPSSQISFRVTSITVISSFHDQPFIENVRQENGSVKLTSVIPEFAKWAYSQMKILPKFDVIMGVTATNLDGNTVGVAYGRAACLVEHLNDGGKYVSAVVIADKGTWSVGAAAHELGHLLGASHDVDIKGCNHTGFIMSGMDPETQYFFSSCSDKLISEFLKTNQAGCLKRHDHVFPGNKTVLPIPAVRLPSMKEQCRRLLQNEKAFVLQQHSKCQEIKCAESIPGRLRIRSHYPVDGSTCKVGNDEIGRCFWGKCLPLGFLLVNTANGKCIGQTDIFSMNDYPVIRNCTEMPTPLDQFFIWTDGESGREFLATPNRNMENGVKCLQMHLVKNGKLTADLSFVNCSESSRFTFEWKKKDDTHGHLIMKDGFSSTYYCVGYDNNATQMIAHKNCDTNDAKMLWKRVDAVQSSFTDFDIWEGSIIQNINKKPKIWADEYWTYGLAVWTLAAMGLIASSLIIYFLKGRASTSGTNNGSESLKKWDAKGGLDEQIRLTASQRVNAELLIE